MPYTPPSTLRAQRDRKDWAVIYNKKADLDIKEQGEICLEDLNFFFWDSAIELFLRLWNENIPGFEIARRLERDQDEIALLIMHLRRQSRIRNRPGGYMGGIISGRYQNRMD